MNSVLAEIGTLSQAQAIDLSLFGGGRIETTGIIRRMPQTGAMLRAAFDKGGWQAWVPRVDNPERIEFVERVDPRASWRVLDRINVGSTTRLQLIHPRGESE